MAFNIAEVGVDKKTGAPIIQRTNSFLYNNDPNGRSDIFYYLRTNLGSYTSLTNSLEFIEATKLENGVFTDSANFALGNKTDVSLFDDSNNLEDGIHIEFKKNEFKIKQLQINSNSAQWQLLGSNDNSLWNVVDLGAAQNIGNKWILTPALNNNFYKYYRLISNQVNLSKELNAIKFFGEYNSTNLSFSANDEAVIIATHGDEGVIYLPDPSLLSISKNFYVVIYHVGVHSYTFSLFENSVVSITDNTDGSLAQGEQLFVRFTGSAWELNKIGAGINLESKGALLTSTGEEQSILPVGSDGQVVSANSNTSIGIEWIDLPLSGIIDGPFTPTPATANYPVRSAGSFDDIINAMTVAEGGNPHTTGSIEVFRDNPGSAQGAINTGLGITNPESLVDQNLGAPSPTGLAANTFQSYLIDFKSNSVRLTDLRLYGEKTSAVIFPALILTSDTGAAGSWTNQGSGAGAPQQNAGWGSLFTLNSPEFARYLRIAFNLGGGQGGPGVLGEIELYGDATLSGLNSYALNNNWNNKYVEFSSVQNHLINIDVDSITSIENKFITLIKNATEDSTVNLNALGTVEIDGQTLLQPNDAVFLIKIDTNKYFVSPVAKNKQQVNPFSSLRQDLTTTLQLTKDSPKYLYLDPQSNTYDVVLTNPPSTNDFFYIVNRTKNGDIQIKETATGGVVQLLNSNVPVAQCHYDGVEWQIITLGNI